MATLTSISDWRGLVAVASLLTLLGLALSAVPGAGADEFEPQNTAPTVDAVNAPASIQPTAGSSTAVYEIAVDVTDAETLNDLDTVVVCFYHTTEGDNTCATPDARNTVRITWTQSTDSFAILPASTFWALGTDGDASTSPTLTSTTGTFTFRFRVSEATRQGGWTADATATDSSAASDTGTDTTTVNHFSAITTRVSQDFGTLATGFAGSATRTASPTVTANGPTTYSMQAENFTDGTFTFTLLTTGTPATAEPGVGEVTFDCNRAGTFDAATATRIGTTATQIAANQTAAGTPEGGTALDNTCRLAHGGQRPVASYSATVVNIVAEDAG